MCRTAQQPGIIPFRVRIGVTGHRDVTSRQTLVDVPARVRELLPRGSATRVRLGVVSALAEGADRLVVDEVFAYADVRNEDARLEVILPFDRSRYVREQRFSAAAEATFTELLDRATSVTELDGSGSYDGSLDRAYEAAGRQVVARSDVLVALWDGEASRGRGGTAETLLHATEMGKPCIWVPTDGGPVRATNFAAGSNRRFRLEVRRRVAVPRQEWTDLSGIDADTLEPLERAFREFEAFNAARVPSEGDMRRRIERELGAVDASSDWVAWPFGRAACLADRLQTRFVRALWLMAAFAIGAAASLAVSVSREHPSRGWAWAEVSCLLALVAVFAVMRRARLHARWLSYRLLAERLRSSYFIAPTNVEFGRTTGLDSIFVESRSFDWLLRAFEEVWDSRPNAVGSSRPIRDEDLPQLKKRLADDWIGGQIAFHAKARRQHQRRAVVLSLLIYLCLFGTLVAAGLHALTTFGEEWWIVCTVTLPVTGAALGIVLDVRQHHALAERYGRMHSTLLITRQALRDADARTIGTKASEAARVIAEENGDWFGSMWFLDVEHPP
jgi:hypothetical protein